MYSFTFVLLNMNYLLNILFSMNQKWIRFFPPNIIELFIVMEIIYLQQIISFLMFRFRI